MIANLASKYPRFAAHARLHGGMLLILFAYHRLATPAGIASHRTVYLTEFPLMWGLFASLLVLLKPTRLRPLWAAIPILATYGLHDYHVVLFQRVPDWRDFAKLAELYEVLPWVAVPLFLLLTGLIVAGLRQIAWSPWSSKRMLTLLPWLALATAILAAPTFTTDALRSNLSMKRWSDIKNVRSYGRVFMTLVREAEFGAATADLHAFEPITTSAHYITPQEYTAYARRDLYLVVLESFFDPRNFEGVTFNRSPFHPDFERLTGTALSGSLAPSFAGGTAKSEFEILCGVPAWGRFGYEEFRLLKGSPTYCLPNILGRLGYVSDAYHPFKPSMYNRPRAYQSLGFDTASFLDWYGTPHGISRVNKASKYVLDGDLYDLILESGGDTSAVAHFKYALTMDGHHPFNPEPRARPPVITTTPSVPVLEVVANQIYYRSKALTDYVERILAATPDALIIAVGDHLPPFPEGRSFYERWGYKGTHTGSTEQRWRETPLLVVDGGEVVNTGLLAHHQIYTLVLNTLSAGSYCAARSDTRPCFSDPTHVMHTVALQHTYTTILGMGFSPTE